MDARDELRVLATALGLNDESQDWGIINADSGRISEFIRYAETTALTTAQQFAIGELVLASVNDALADGAAKSNLVDKLERCLTSGLSGMEWHLAYWSSLQDEAEFPVARLLRWLVKHPGTHSTR